MTEPEKITVTRYRCPHCSRSRASKKAIVAHIARCWHNPEARSCKTCDNYVPYSSGCGEYGCNGCGNEEHCTAGLPLAVKGDPFGAGLPVHCPKWEAEQ